MECSHCVKNPVIVLKFYLQLGQERSSCDRHGVGLKPTRSILLCPWERHFTTLSFAW